MHSATDSGNGFILSKQLYHHMLLFSSAGVMPKHGLDVAACEVYRFYKLVTLRGLIEPISMIVPRRVSGTDSALIINHIRRILHLSSSNMLKGC